MPLTPEPTNVENSTLNRKGVERKCSLKDSVKAVMCGRCEVRCSTSEHTFGPCADLPRHEGEKVEPYKLYKENRPVLLKCCSYGVSDMEMKHSASPPLSISLQPLMYLSASRTIAVTSHISAHGKHRVTSGGMFNAEHV